MEKNLTTIFQGFSKLSKEERFMRLKEAEALSDADIDFLKRGGLKSTELGEKFIENVIGYFQMPLGVATHFRIDGRDLFIPMSVEETSIIAAASKTAKWIREAGDITTWLDGQDIIGQIQIAKVQNRSKLNSMLSKNKDHLIDLANKEVAFGLVRRGGGVRNLVLRELERPDGLVMAVIHVHLDPCDAMGANIINQVCEFLKGPIEELTGEKVSMCILSNLVDTRITGARVRVRQVPRDLAEKIVEASIFAEIDPYRAATNNKGVLNGMDPIVMATGNDWRAVEAGVHAFAARSGSYRSITEWRIEPSGEDSLASSEKDLCTLVGTLMAPICVGTVGGVTRLHPLARMSLDILGVATASELSRVIAAVGLVQNLGAIRALVTEGIIEGHMKLHIKNLSLGAGASEDEMPFVAKKLEEILALTKRISLSHAQEVLASFREQKAQKLDGDFVLSENLEVRMKDSQPVQEGL